MLKRRFYCTLCLLLAVLCGCAANAPLSQVPPHSALETPTVVAAIAEAHIERITLPTETEPVLTKAELLLSQMTLRQKVGQLFIVLPDALTNGATPPTFLTEDMAASLTQYPVGGIIQFSGNILSPEQIVGFNRSLQGASSIPLFLCVDEEGGTVARLANSSTFHLPRYTSAGHVGKNNNSGDALEMGRTIGSYLTQFGFNVDLAPVADVNTNPYNTVIGNRAFSSDPKTAAAMASAFASGLHENGSIATYKHFPGHGDTAQDSHFGLAVSYKTAEELAQCEWLPFMQATDRDLVMTGHIALPNVTGNMIPATLSRQIVTDILKGQLGFDGLVITDSMQMGAITGAHSSGEAAVLALQAGCDIILMPQHLPEAFEAVVGAVEDGTLSMAWLDETVLRILEFKSSHGIL